MLPWERQAFIELSSMSSMVDNLFRADNWSRYRILHTNCPSVLICWGIYFLWRLPQLGTLHCIKRVIQCTKWVCDNLCDVFVSRWFHDFAWERSGSAVSCFTLRRLNDLFIQAAHLGLMGRHAGLYLSRIWGLTRWLCLMYRDWQKQWHVGYLLESLSSQKQVGNQRE